MLLPLLFIWYRIILFNLLCFLNKWRHPSLNLTSICSILVIILIVTIRWRFYLDIGSVRILNYFESCWLSALNLPLYLLHYWRLVALNLVIVFCTIQEMRHVPALLWSLSPFFAISARLQAFHCEPIILWRLCLLVWANWSPLFIQSLWFRQVLLFQSILPLIRSRLIHVGLMLIR